MASAMLKSLKVIRTLNGRLSFSSTKLHFFNSRFIVRPYEYSKNNKMCYATAAYKKVSNDESFVKNKDVLSSKIQNTNSIDNAVSKLDGVVRRFGRINVKELENILSMLTSKDMTSSTHGLYLLRGCKYCYSEPPAKRINLANQIWNKYQELGIQFDVSHYNALLDVHISNGLSFNPVEILSSMEDSGIEPNRNTYLLVMKKYCEDGNINGASEILEHMKEKGLPANEDVFNNLIRGHIKNNDFSGAKDVLEVMRSSNLQPTADTYTILACGHASSGNKDEMMSFLGKMDSESNVQNHLKVIDALASSGNHQHIDEVLFMIKHKQDYQQEFVNCAIEFLHKDLVDVAYKLIIASCSPDYEHAFHIFIKQLIRIGRPVSEIVNYSSEIFSNGYSDTIFLSATKTAAECRRLDCIVPIFKKIGELGHYIRPSTFWPLIATFKNEKSAEGVWALLKHMCELGVPCDFTTYYEVIFPMLGEPHPNSIIYNVEKTGQSKSTAADALFLYYTDLGHIDYLHHLTEIAHVRVSEKINVKNFLNLYDSLTSDVRNKYLKVLRYMFMDENHLLEHDDIRSRLLAEMISTTPRLLEQLLGRYKDLHFSVHTIQSCSKILSQSISFRNNYQRTLRRLHSMSVEREILFKEDLSFQEEKEQVKYLLSQNVPCSSFLLRRINYHIKKKDHIRVSELLSLHDELKMPYTPLMLSNLSHLYILGSDVEKATEYYNKLKTEFPTFKMNLSRYFDYITLLVKYQKLDESIEALKSITEPYLYDSRDNIVRKIRSLNLAIANTKNAEFAKTMQDLLLPISKEFRTKKAFLDSVLQLHLQTHNFTAALEEFKNCIVNHHTPVGLNIFLKKCINANEKDVLQKVIDLTINCTSQSHALLELAVAFIETRNFEKAVAVIESLGQGANPKDVELLCTRLSSQYKLLELEHFLSITKCFNHDNRENLYALAIKAYAAKNYLNKAIELFEALKKEVGMPSNNIVNYIQELLTKHNKPVPLSVVSSEPLEANPLIAEATKTFMEYLEAGNVEAALKEVSEMKKGYVRTLSLKALTDLVDLCLQENCLMDLTAIVNVMSYILDNPKDVLKPVTEKYSTAGDIEKLATISRIFPDFALMNFGFNTYFCKAFIAKGKQEELLTHFEQRVDKRNKLFCIAAFEDLIKYPEYEDKIFDLAVKYYDSDFKIPMSSLWALYFSKENYEKAEKIFKNFSVYIDKVDSIVIRNIRQNENVALAQKYVEVTKFLNVRDRVRQRAYGAALDVLVLKGMYDEAVALVLDSEKVNLDLSKFYLSTLVTLKNILEKENKSVPFRLPLDVSSGSSSDSN